MTKITFNIEFNFDYLFYLYIIEKNNINLELGVKYQLVDSLELDMETLRVNFIDEDKCQTSIRLSKAEANILYFLFENKDKVINKETLIDIGWGDRKVGNNSMNVAIYNLRKCLNSNENINLNNIPKIGYKLTITANSLPIIEKSPSISREGKEEIKPAKNTILNKSKNSTFIKASLIILNLVVMKFMFITYLNLVDVTCHDNEIGSICYSKSYQGQKEIASPGMTVLSNIFSFHNNKIERVK